MSNNKVILIITGLGKSDEVAGLIPVLQSFGVGGDGVVLILLVLRLCCLFLDDSRDYQTTRFAIERQPSECQTFIKWVNGLCGKNMFCYV
jgi:hypothetical protein